MFKSIMTRPRWSWLWLVVLASGLIHQVAAKSQDPLEVAQMSAPEIEDALQVGISIRYRIEF